MNESQKSGRYERLITQLKDLLTVTPDPVSRMATAAALLYHKMGHFYWIGFYRLVDGDLLVGPYQGTLACQKLKHNTGVCWTGVNQNKSIVVPDVHQFPGHIACDSRSKSEIVVPVHDIEGKVAAVLDADSDKLNTFDAIDEKYLCSVAELIYVK